ncbi:hypothetical protein BCR32DRAFT_303127 [Anaeromyces robustus]|uniref:Uncharacterized protein n=1 Tax=Anaeromyces robustus TaxID=1754192 RepID=A0A1Y1WTF0_9FUNG|nr:hypothetical protein BCR32DRAFT_303127 [Anaeromyces robustus]|eukprot:ORX76820.1 hypothetical protein BCR32DRAFT_303127 [Anaeromyces robustus]
MIKFLIFIKKNITEFFNRKITFMEKIYNSVEYNIYKYIKPNNNKKYDENINIPSPYNRNKNEKKENSDNKSLDLIKTCSNSWLKKLTDKNLVNNTNRNQTDTNTSIIYDDSNEDIYKSKRVFNENNVPIKQNNKRKGNIDTVINNNSNNSPRPQSKKLFNHKVSQSILNKENTKKDIKKENKKENNKNIKPVKDNNCVVPYNNVLIYQNNYVFSVLDIIDQSSILNLSLPYKEEDEEEESYKSFDFIEIYTFKSLISNIIKKNCLTKKKLSNAIAYEVLLKFCYKKRLIKCLESFVFNLNMKNQKTRLLNFNTHYTFRTLPEIVLIERMKDLFDKIIHDENDIFKSLINSSIEKEAIKLLKLYFYDIIKSNINTNIDKNNNHNHNKNHLNDGNNQNHNKNFENDSLSVASSSSFSEISLIEYNNLSKESYGNLHPVRTIDEKDPTLCYISSEENSINLNINKHSYPLIEKQHQNFIDIKDISKYIDIKSYLCRLSFIKIIRLFKYIEKHI